METPYPFVLLWPTGLEVHLEKLAQDLRCPKKEDHDSGDAPNRFLFFEGQLKCWRELLAAGRKSGLPPPRELPRLTALVIESLKTIELQDGSTACEIELLPSPTDLWSPWQWFARLCDQNTASRPDPGLLRGLAGQSVYRFFSARDAAAPAEGQEALAGIWSRRCFSLSDAGALAELPGGREDSAHHSRLAAPQLGRIARFIDHLTEEVEALCLSCGTLPLISLQERIDSTQRFLHQEPEDTASLAGDDAQVVRPLLGNIEAFLESLDQVVRTFVQDPARACSVSLTLLALHEGLALYPEEVILLPGVPSPFTEDPLGPVRQALGPARANLWTRDARPLRQALERLRSDRKAPLPPAKPRRRRGLARTAELQGGNTEPISMVAAAGRQQRNGSAVARTEDPGAPPVPAREPGLDLHDVFENYHPWMCAGPRILTSLSIAAAEQAIEERDFGFAADILRAFHPPTARTSAWVGEPPTAHTQTKTSAAPRKPLAAGAFRLMRAFSGLTSLLIPLGVVLLSWGVFEALRHKAGVLEFFGRLAGSGFHLDSPAGMVWLSLVLLLGLLLIRGIAAFLHREPLDPALKAWHTHYRRAHLRLWLPPYFFKAGFGVFAAATLEFDYQLWFKHLYPQWHQVAVCLLLLCFLGCLLQLPPMPAGLRLKRASRTLCMFSALATLPAVTAAIVLHPAFVHLVGKIAAWKNPPDPGLRVFLYSLMFMALTGVLIGVLGDVARRGSGRKG